jgi:hypothetical protein
MKVLIKNIGENTKITDIENDLQSLQNLVGGYIEALPLTKDVLLICNEEGKLKGLPVNFNIVINGKIESIVGNVFFVGKNDSDFDSLTNEQIIILQDYLDN